MSYIINKYDGTAILELQDGTISQNLSLKLVGKNYPGYGEAFNENFLFLLENFSKATAPANSIRGQLWYDLTENKLKIQNQNGLWKSVSGAEVSDTEPTEQGIGSFWFDNTNKQLYVYDGTLHNLIGPEVSAGFGITRLQSEVIIDTLNVKHPIIYGFVGGEICMVISNADFTVTELTGFANIKRGINLKDGFNITGNVTGNASTATKLQTVKKINGVNFDGTDDITILSSTTNKLIPGSFISGQQFDGSDELTWAINATSQNNNNTVVARDENGNFVANTITANLTGNVTGNLTGNVVGNANTATALQNTVKINGVNFNGASDITILSSTTQKLSVGNFIIGQDFDGSVATSWTIDATSQNTANKVVSRDNSGNFSANIISANLIGNVNGNVSGNVTGNLTGNVSGNVTGNLTGNVTGNVAGNITGNANSANKLTTGKNINGVNFDGTADITVFDNTKLPTAGGTLTGFLTLHANPTLSMHATPLGYVDDAIKHAVPTGVIVMWYGTKATIPAGWYACDGTNGTPDLRDRFPMGAGTKNNGQTGGSNTSTLAPHSHGFSSNSTTTDSGSHAHSLNVTGTAVTGGTHGHTITDAGHIHQSQYDGRTPGSIDYNMSGSEIGGMGTSYNYPTTKNTTGITINTGGAHSHSVAVSGNTDSVTNHNHTVSISGSTDQQGISNPEGNLPPYYAVWFIMKG